MHICHGVLGLLCFVSLCLTSRGNNEPPENVVNAAAPRASSITECSVTLLDENTLRIKTSVLVPPHHDALIYSPAISITNSPYNIRSEVNGAPPPDGQCRKVSMDGTTFLTLSSGVRAYVTNLAQAVQARITFDIDITSNEYSTVVALYYPGPRLDPPIDARFIMTADSMHAEISPVLVQPSSLEMFSVDDTNRVPGADRIWTPSHCIGDSLGWEPLPLIFFQNLQLSPQIRSVQQVTISDVIHTTWSVELALRTTQSYPTDIKFSLPLNFPVSNAGYPSVKLVLNAETSPLERCDNPNQLSPNQFAVCNGQDGRSQLVFCIALRPPQRLAKVIVDFVQAYGEDVKTDDQFNYIYERPVLAFGPRGIRREGAYEDCYFEFYVPENFIIKDATHKTLSDITVGRTTVRFRESDLVNSARPLQIRYCRSVLPLLNFLRIVNTLLFGVIIVVIIAFALWPPFASKRYLLIFNRLCFAGFFVSILLPAAWMILDRSDCFPSILRALFYTRVHLAVIGLICWACYHSWVQRRSEKTPKDGNCGVASV